MIWAFASRLRLAVVFIGILVVASCSQAEGEISETRDPSRLKPKEEASPDDEALTGTIVFSDENEVFKIRADGEGLRQLTHGPRHEIDPDLSPNGRRIAYRVDRGRDAFIYLMRADGSHQHVLVKGLSPAWSPDGKWIAFGDNQGYISVIRPDGTRQHRVRNTVQGEYPSWSPDGLSIVFNSFMNGPSDLFRVGVDGSHLSKLTDSPGEVNLPDWSPDGQTILYGCHRNGSVGGPSVCSIPADGGDPRDLRYTDAEVAVWSPDGGYILVGGVSLTAYRWRGSNPDVVGQRVGSVSPALFPDWGI